MDENDRPKPNNDVAKAIEITRNFLDKLISHEPTEPDGWIIDDSVVMFDREAVKALHAGAVVRPFIYAR